MRIGWIRHLGLVESNTFVSNWQESHASDYLRYTVRLARAAARREMVACHGHDHQDLAACATAPPPPQLPP